MGWKAIRRIPPFRRYLRRQVSISNCDHMCERTGSVMGPCLRRGLREERANLYPHTPPPWRMSGSPAVRARSPRPCFDPGLHRGRPAQHERSQSVAKTRLILREVEGWSRGARNSAGWAQAMRYPPPRPAARLTGGYWRRLNPPYACYWGELAKLKRLSTMKPSEHGEDPAS